MQVADPHGGTLTTIGPDSPKWRTSTSCESGACVQVACSDEGVAVRSSPTSPVLIFGLRSWEKFIDAVKSGAFDLHS